MNSSTSLKRDEHSVTGVLPIVRRRYTETIPFIVKDAFEKSMLWSQSHGGLGLWQHHRQALESRQAQATTQQVITWIDVW